MELLKPSQGAPKNMEEAKRKQYQFWDTQPVPKLGTGTRLFNTPLIKYKSSGSKIVGYNIGLSLYENIPVLPCIVYCNNKHYEYKCISILSNNLVAMDLGRIVCVYALYFHLSLS